MFAFSIGAVFILLQTLQYSGFIKIDYETLQRETEVRLLCIYIHTVYISYIHTVHTCIQLHTVLNSFLLRIYSQFLHKHTYIYSGIESSGRESRWQGRRRRRQDGVQQGEEAIFSHQSLFYLLITISLTLYLWCSGEGRIGKSNACRYVK